MQVGKPKIIFHVENNITYEPFEEVSIDIDKKYIGIVVEEIGRRKAQILDVKTNTQDVTRYLFSLSSRNLMGLRSLLISKTGGKGLFASRFIGYKKMEQEVERYRNGVIIALENGKSTSYALETAQQRGTVFIGPGESVYEGMIIGLNSRKEDMEINIIRFKKLTNMHTENSDVAIVLDTPLRLSLEQCIDFLEDDELLEITPLNLRLRKIHLNKVQRKRADKRNNGEN